MNPKQRFKIILSVVAGYIIFQFVWWEILLVRQNNLLSDEKQKLFELSISREPELKKKLMQLQDKKIKQTLMIAGEGTVFLLLLLFGIHRINKSHRIQNELNERQKNFLLSVTHELKTPIASTKLQLQTLQKQKLDEAARERILSAALAENERLNNLIDNVLLASRLESGEFGFRTEILKLDELLFETLNRYYKNEILKKEITMSLEKDVECKLDPAVFPSVITNLVDNAIKYSGEQKEIRVELKKNHNRISLTVSDRGFGIAESEKEKIFGRFYRSGSEEIRRSKGTGLGLHIARYIVHQHQAEIKVRDNRPIGSIFEILFNEG